MNCPIKASGRDFITTRPRARPDKIYRLGTATLLIVPRRITLSQRWRFFHGMDRLD